ncbi:MAG: NAD(P)-dependent oxidoreductase [Chthoniobacteraceae bacterium]
MHIYFVDPEPSEQRFLCAALPGHRLHFLTSASDVPADAELLSIFINVRIDDRFLEEHPKLRFIALRSTTHDHVDLAECERWGVTVSYVPTYGANTVAEHTFALMLAVARNLRAAMTPDRQAISYEALRGFELCGKTLGVIGTGRVGLHVLHLAKAFSMRTIAHDIKPRPSIARQLGFSYVGLAELLHESDIISLHAALTPKTFHLLDAAAFARCRKGVVIINTARGALVESDALLAAIDAGIVGGAGLDVLEDERVLCGSAGRLVTSQIVDHLHGFFHPAEPRPRDPARVREIASLLHNEELLRRTNVVFTPHIAFNSAEAIERINRTTAENCEAYLCGRPTNVLRAQPPQEEDLHPPLQNPPQPMPLTTHAS